MFTRNATEGLNVVAQAWGMHNLKPGDEASAPACLQRQLTAAGCLPAMRCLGLPWPSVCSKDSLELHCCCRLCYRWRSTTAL